MVRVRFFQDTFLLDYNTVRRENQEFDLDFTTAYELYQDNKVDILNPYKNSDLKENIDDYKKDWQRFAELEGVRP